MKQVLVWVFRLVCLAIICAAGYTLVGCLMHMNDDHSFEAVMGTSYVNQTFEESTVTTITAPMAEQEVIESVDENPTVVLDCADTVSVYSPYLAVTAVFEDIETSISADLSWYVDGELASVDQQHLLVEGSTASCSLRVNTSGRAGETSEIRLEVSFQKKTIEAETEVTVAMRGDGTDYVHTEDISVTIKKSCSFYADSDKTKEMGVLQKKDTALLMGYETDEDGDKLLKLQLSEDGTIGWIDAKNANITDEVCTTEKDFTDEVKEEFVNDESLGYDSRTDYLIWVSLYTQKVNIFRGYEGQWELYKCFDCSSGANETPTTTGTFTYSTQVERWDLGDTYVSPVLVFNGGEAFTSRPYKTEDGTVADETIGTPSSGGSVRMLGDDIRWMAESIPTGTLVVVY